MRKYQGLVFVVDQIMSPLMALQTMAMDVIRRGGGLGEHRAQSTERLAMAACKHTA